MISPLINYQQVEKNNSQKKNKKINKTLEGVLINSHVKDNCYDQVNFHDICNSLMISQKNVGVSNCKNNDKLESFNMKQSFVPLAISVGVMFFGAAILSLIIKQSANKILNTKNFEKLPDLALNMNIKQEPQFAVYRALRDPNVKNILGASAVFLWSGLTLGAKNFVDGVKEIWVKKRESDIERDLQENLIEVEAKSFSGKLQAVNSMLSSKVNYFQRVLNTESYPLAKTMFFRKTLGFKSKNQSEDKKIFKSNGLKYIGLSLGIILTAVVLGKVTFFNFRKALQKANEYTNQYTQKTIDMVEDIVKSGDKSKVSVVENLLQSISAKPSYVKKVMGQLGLSQDDIEKTVEGVDIARKTLFADAPVALGGIPKKIQYYCYLDEDRGHLYNWIINPQNKFTKYIFLAFSAVTSVGYIFKQSVDAIKAVAVAKENSKTELSLKKRLVSVEIENFKAKKNGAIQLLMDIFHQKLQNSADKKELKQFAENVLTEIKNGPPYIYS